MSNMKRTMIEIVDFSSWFLKSEYQKLVYRSGIRFNQLKIERRLAIDGYEINPSIL